MIAGKFICRVLAVVALVWCGAVQADLAPYSSFVNVRVADGCEGMGTVSGGNQAIWSFRKTTIKATAKKGHAFEGWYMDGSCVSRDASYSFYVGERDATYEARFIAARDDWLYVEGSDKEFDVGDSIDGYGNLGEYFTVDSGSPPTIKMSGLPSGVKYDTKTKTFSGAPTKRGVYYVTCSVQNGNGYKQASIAVWNVGSASNGDYDNIGLGSWFDEEQLENLAVGVAIDEFCTNLKQVSGLPTGLKFIAGSKCTSGGSCTACSGFISGTPTKPGVFKATFTDYYNNKAVKTLIVADCGSGYIDVLAGSGYGLCGTVSGSGVYATGSSVKLSAKPASGYYFAGWYEDSACETPFFELADWRKASDSFVFRRDEMEGMCLYARFVSKSNDNISIEGSDSWNVDDDYSYDYEVLSETLPTDTVKGLPSGIKWDKDGRYFYVSDNMKLKPGTTTVTITTKNLSGRTATKNVRIVVPNLQSWVFEGLDYSDNAYNLTVGVSDVCVMSWLSFEYNEAYKVTVSGLPPGMKYMAEDGFIAFRGTPTKAGTYTVTLTAKRGTSTEKATFTINVDPLPAYAIGTFNGVLKDEDGNEIIGTFVFTAAANGKQSVKVVTELGTMSLSAPAWNCYDDYGNPTAYFSKYSKNEDFSFMLTPMGSVDWNCEHQLEGTLSWRKTSTSGEAMIDAFVSIAQRNPFAKTGNAYDHPVAVDVAESLASEYKSMKMVLQWDSDSEAYYLDCADCVLSGSDDGTATLKMNKNGTVTLSGKLYGQYSFSVTTTLLFDTACEEHGSLLYGEHCYALFGPVVKMKVCAHSSSSEKCFTENELVPIYWTPLYD